MLSTRKLRVAAGLAVSALVAVVAVSTGTSADEPVGEDRHLGGH